MGACWVGGLIVHAGVGMRVGIYICIREMFARERASERVRDWASVRIMCADCVRTVCGLCANCVRIMCELCANCVRIVCGLCADRVRVECVLSACCVSPAEERWRVCG